MVDLLIRNGTVVTADGVGVADVAIDGGRIVGAAGPARQEIDATGLHVFPGLIDVHVHFNDPGRADWEGAGTGSAALAAGGGTCFFDMPLNSAPPVIDAGRFNEKVSAMAGHSYADFGLWGGIVPGNLAADGRVLADRGVVGFKAFMSNSGIDDFGRADDLTLLRGMAEAARLGLPVAVHAESEELTGRLTAEARAAGRTGVRDYLDTRPIVAEVDAIRRAVLFAAEAGCQLHVVHVSSAAGMAAVTAGGPTRHGRDVRPLPGVDRRRRGADRAAGQVCPAAAAGGGGGRALGRGERRAGDAGVERPLAGPGVDEKLGRLLRRLGRDRRRAVDAGGAADPRPAGAVAGGGPVDGAGAG